MYQNQETMNTLGRAAVLRELECPICWNFMVPPIRQCCNGHSVCETCYLKLKQCPICQGKFTKVRNRSLEAVLEAVASYPCVNEKFGCKYRMLTVEARAQHEWICEYKTVFPCILEECSWIGRREDILQHWTSKQLTVSPYTENNICYMELSNGFYHVNLVKAYNQLFWFKQKTAEDMVYFVVNFIGDCDTAKKYSYEIQIGRQKKQFFLRDSCQLESSGETKFKPKMENWISVKVKDIKKYCNCIEMTLYRMRVLQRQ